MSAFPNDLPFHKRGDTWDGMVFSLRSKPVPPATEGDPISLVGASILMQVRSLDTRDGKLLLEISDWTIDGNSASCPGRIVDIIPGIHWYEIQITWPDGNPMGRRTVPGGRWEIGTDIAHLFD